MGQTLFIGNGVNRLTNSTSWRDVLEALAQFAQKHDIVMRHIDDKPFTLVFEEVFLRAARTRRITEQQLKAEAARLIQEIPPSNYHARIMGLGSDHVLTSNYDYNLEGGIDARGSDVSLRPEQKYSLFRRRQVGNQYVWHIHGEASSPRSLSLGHEHYSGSLQHVRDYLTTRRKRSNRGMSPFMTGNLRFEATSAEYSWLDLFMRDDVHVYGFSFDYTEIELWWLLAFKERQRLKGRKVGRTLYYSRDSERRLTKERARLGLLASFGVDIIPLKGTTYAEAFEAFLRSYARRSEKTEPG